MSTPVIARWDNLRSLVQSAHDTCTVFSPFYSNDGLELIENSLCRSVSFNMWTRLSLRDWASGVADPEALCKLLAKLEDTRRPTQLITNAKLHAKAYFADVSSALVGSANLSRGGFATNVELMVELDAEGASEALNVLTVASSQLAVPIANEELESWVAQHAELVQRARTNLRKNLDELDAAQRDIDIGIDETPAVIEPTQELLDEFVGWLAVNRHLPGAAHLVTLHHDHVVQRQQGHVKQCFSGVFRFLQEYPSWIQRLSEAADAADGMVRPGGWLFSDWSSHLEEHADVFSDLYSYETLRRVLPANCGGTHTSGGGAGTTLRRILPLVALFMLNRERGAE